MDSEQISQWSDVAQHAYFWLFTVLGSGGLLVWKVVRARKVGHRSLQAYVSSRHGDGDDLLVRVAKSLTCLVVDDKPDDFPSDFLRGMFKSVSFETKVSLNDARRLSEFDVIFLDVAGVVVEDLQRGGALLIKDIRNLRSDGLIISVSSKKYDVEVTDYFEIADVRIRKPVQAAIVQQQVMAHLRNEAGPFATAQKIDSRLALTERKGLRRRLLGLLESKETLSSSNLPSEILVAGLSEDFLRLHGQIRRLGA